MNPPTPSLLSACIALAFSAIAEAQTTVISINDGIGEDLFVHSGVAVQNTNFSNVEALNVYAWTNGGVFGIKRAFLRFDLSIVPAGAVVTAARLSLFFNPDDAIESVDEHSGDNSWVLQRVVGSWDPTITTWNTQPTVTAQNAVTVPATTSSTQDFENIDVTTLVQDMIVAGESGFRVSLVDEQLYRMLILASGEDTDANRHPRLEVDYTLTSLSLAEFTSVPPFNANWQVDGALRIEVNGALPPDTWLELVDSWGRTLASTSISDRITVMRPANITPGAYTLVLQTKEGRSVVRLVRADRSQE